MEKVDEIIPFNHDETWVKKMIFKYFLVDEKKFTSNGYEISSVQKVFVPFYKLNLDGEIHSFMNLYVRGNKGGYTKLVEMDYDYTLNTSICGNNEIDLDKLKNVGPFNDISREKAETNYDGIFIDYSTQLEVGCSERNVIVDESKIQKREDAEVLLSLQNAIVSEDWSGGSATEYNSDISYSINGIKRYYYPVWIVKIKNENEELEYYINDCNGNFDGPKPKIKSRIEDKFVYVLVGFCALTIPLAVVMFYIPLQLVNFALGYLILFVISMLASYIVVMPDIYRIIRRKYNNFLVKKRKKNRVKSYYIISSYEKALNEYFKSNWKVC